MKKTPLALSRIVEAWKKGYSVSFIARTERVARPTVKRWLAEAGIDTNAPRAR